MFLLSPLPRHFCLCLILQFLLPLFLLSSLRVLSPDSSLLPSSTLTWPVWFQWFLVICGALRGAPLLSAASVCSAPIGSSAGLYGFASLLSRPSGAPCLHAVLLPGAPGFSAASFLTPFCAAPLASAAGLFGFASPLSRPS